MPEHVDETYIMVFDVEHTGCTDAHALQLSWGLYKRDGNLIETKDYFLQISNHRFISSATSMNCKNKNDVLAQNSEQFITLGFDHLLL